MQAPLWKAHGTERASLNYDFVEIVKACAAIGIKILVLPLVDNGRLENANQEDDLVGFLVRQSNLLLENDLKIVFESDYVPQELARFIARLDTTIFGINYDIGNSAALGYNPLEEMAMYGSRIANVHVKDRLHGGNTVPLGAGNANFDTVFKALAQNNYQGKFILQTARASDGEHVKTLCVYRDMTIEWIKRYGT